MGLCLKPKLSVFSRTGSSLFVTDHNPGTATDTQPLFAMSGDNNDNVHIPMLFLFHKEGQALIDAWEDNNALQVMMTDKVMIFGEFVCIQTSYFVLK